MEIRENALLAPLTTFGIGGPARFFARACSIEEVREGVVFARARGIPLFVLGGGSNVLISDAGFEGLVLKLERMGEASEDAPEGQALIAAAGESWDAVVLRAVHENLWGIENLSGIPGSVGGAVAANIGAYGAALSEILRWVEVLDTASGDIRRISNEECAFGYRDSIFKRDNGRHIILRAAFSLSRAPLPNLSYRDLAERFASAPQPSLPQIRTAILEIRAGKFPDLSREGTAGSYFKNPILPQEQAQALKGRYPGMPLFSMPETAGIKVPLAWLLDRGLGLKGAHIGGARLFERQPLVIAADRGTTSADVLALAELVRTRVRDAFGIEVEEEVRIIA